MNTPAREFLASSDWRQAIAGEAFILAVATPPLEWLGGAAPPAAPHVTWTLREYSPQDQEAVAQIIAAPIDAGQEQASPAPTANAPIQPAELENPQNRFWVAEIGGRVVGLVGVLQEGLLAQMGRLHLTALWRQTDLLSEMLRTALAFCNRSGLLKVVIHSNLKVDVQSPLIADCGFQFSRSRGGQQGPERLELYANLYQRPDRALAP